jgi:hypothetical protein
MKQVSRRVDRVKGSGHSLKQFSIKFSTCESTLFKNIDSGQRKSNAAEDTYL